jgi:hypothetical protein
LTTSPKDFRVKNGLQVGQGGSFGGAVVVGTPTSDTHAATKAYVDLVAGGATSYTFSTGLTLSGSTVTVDQSIIAPLNSPTFTGTVTLPNTTSIGDISSTELSFLNNVTSNIQSQLDGKSPTAGSTSITTVGTVTTATSPTAAGSKGLRNITISTADPTGGLDGDVWLVYE